MPINAIKCEVFERTDSGAGYRFLGWKVYINGKKYPLSKGEWYNLDNSEEGKERAIEYAKEEVLKSLQPVFGWVKRDWDTIPDDEWHTYTIERRDAFYDAGHKLKPQKDCNVCDHHNDYICIDHEFQQLEKKGFT